MKNTQIKIPVIISNESEYWAFVRGQDRKINIQERGKLALEHFVTAKENIKSDPNFYKK